MPSVRVSGTIDWASGRTYRDRLDDGVNRVPFPADMGRGIFDTAFFSVGSTASLAYRGSFYDGVTIDSMSVSVGGVTYTVEAGPNLSTDSRFSDVSRAIVGREIQYEDNPFSEREGVRYSITINYTGVTPLRSFSRSGTLRAPRTASTVRSRYSLSSISDNIPIQWTNHWNRNGSGWARFGSLGLHYRTDGADWADIRGELRSQHFQWNTSFRTGVQISITFPNLTGTNSYSTTNLEHEHESGNFYGDISTAESSTLYNLLRRVQIAGGGNYDTNPGGIYDYTLTLSYDPNTAATGQPIISGTTVVGSALTANIGDIADDDGLPASFPGDYSFQWLRNGSTISGATSSSYTLVTADGGQRISVRVSFTDDEGNSESVTSIRTDAISTNNFATGSPNITGSATLGTTLVADSDNIADLDGLTNVSYSWQWFRDNVAISTGTSRLYTIVSADVGSRLSVRASFTDDVGNNEARTSAQTSIVNASATGRPTITGTLTVGSLLTCNDGSIADLNGLPSTVFPSGYSFQWRRGSSDISGATGRTYRLVSSDGGQNISCRVSFTDGDGFSESRTSLSSGVERPNSPATGAPSISGTARVGQTLTAGLGTIADEDGLPDSFPGDYTLQWLRDGSAIAGETSQTYTIVTADAGSNIQIRVLFTDDGGTTEGRTSSAVVPVLVRIDLTLSTGIRATGWGLNRPDLQTIARPNEPLELDGISMGGLGLNANEVELEVDPTIQLFNLDGISMTGFGSRPLIVDAINTNVRLVLNNIGLVGARASNPDLVLPIAYSATVLPNASNTPTPSSSFTHSQLPSGVGVSEIRVYNRELLDGEVIHNFNIRYRPITNTFLTEEAVTLPGNGLMNFTERQPPLTSLLNALLPQRGSTTQYAGWVGMRGFTVVDPTAGRVYVSDGANWVEILAGTWTVS